jgi:SLT domain-containing protein
MPEGSLAGAYVEIHPDLEGFEAELRAKLEEATGGKGGDVKINVDADTGAAEADLEAVKVEADRAGENKTIRVDADTAAANAQLLETRAAADAASGVSGGGGIGGLATAGLALGPALVPAAAASAAGIGALASLTGIAAVGIGSFAALAIPSFQGVGKEVQTISKDQTALNDALTQQDKNRAIQKLREDLSKIPPEQRPVVQGILDLKQSLDNVSASIRPQIFGAFESFLNAGKTLLPQLGPPAQQAALAFTDIGNALNRAFQSPGFHEFMGWVTGQVRGALDSIGIAIGNVARGFGGLLEAFAPLVPGLEGGMDRITASFARWATNLGSSQGFQHFLQYFHDNGAAVSSLIKDVAQAVENIVRAASGFGGIEIRILDDVAKAIGAIASIPGIGPAAVDIGLMAAALQKFGLLSGVVSIIGAIAGHFRDMCAQGPCLDETGNKVGSVGSKAEDAGGKVENAGGKLKGLAGAAAGFGPPGLAVAAALGTIGFLADDINPKISGTGIQLGNVSKQGVQAAASAGVVAQQGNNASTALGNLQTALHLTQPQFADVINFAQQTGLNFGTLSSDAAIAGQQIVQHIRDVASGATNATPEIRQAAQDWINKLNEVPPAAQNAGDNTGTNFGSGMAQKLRDQLPNVQSVLAQYDDALRRGINPVLAAVGAQIDPGVRSALNVGFGGAFGESGLMISGHSAIGQGFTTKGARAIVGEGNPAYPEYVIPTDPAFRSNAQALYSDLGAKLHGLQAGGFMSGADVPQPPSFAQWTFPSDPTTEGAMFHAGAAYEYQKVKSWADAQAAMRAAAAAAGAGIGGLGPAVTGACADWVHQGNLLAGASSRMSDACLMARAVNESGCNPGAVNRTDSNAAAGHPSVGLMQFVPSTFAANSVAGCNDINNPICQVAASAHCDPGNCGHGGYGCSGGCIMGGGGMVGAMPLAAGGIMGAKPWVEWLAANVPGFPRTSGEIQIARQVGLPHLANGGIVTSPTLAAIGERGPEAVVPLGHGGAFGGNVTIDARIVFNGDVTDNIDARIQRAHAAQADRITRKLGLRGVTPAPGGALR